MVNNLQGEGKGDSVIECRGEEEEEEEKRERKKEWKRKRVIYLGDEIIHAFFMKSTVKLQGQIIFFGVKGVLNFEI